MFFLLLITKQRGNIIQNLTKESVYHRDPHITSANYLSGRKIWKIKLYESVVERNGR